MAIHLVPIEIKFCCLILSDGLCRFDEANLDSDYLNSTNNFQALEPNKAVKRDIIQIERQTQKLSNLK